MADDATKPEALKDNLYRVVSNDPGAAFLDRSAMTPEDLGQIDRIMQAVARLNDAQRELAAATRERLELNDTDIRALHLLIVAANSGATVTAGALADHLGISTASVTKLLDRMEVAGHVQRSPHPTDRRALAIDITKEAHERAVETMGRQQARRVNAAARLNPAEREVVIRFLNEMAADLESE